MIWLHSFSCAPSAQTFRHTKSLQPLARAAPMHPPTPLNPPVDHPRPARCNSLTFSICVFWGCTHGWQLQEASGTIRRRNGRPPTGRGLWKGGKASERDTTVGTLRPWEKHGCVARALAVIGECSWRGHYAAGAAGAPGVPGKDKASANTGRFNPKPGRSVQIRPYQSLPG